jgi:hypothetical protein
MTSGPPAKASTMRSIAPSPPTFFLKTGPVVFMDVAKQAGLTTWHRMTVHFS